MRKMIATVGIAALVAGSRASRALRPFPRPHGRRMLTMGGVDSGREGGTRPAERGVRGMVGFGRASTPTVAPPHGETPPQARTRTERERGGRPWTFWMALGTFVLPFASFTQCTYTSSGWETSRSYMPGFLSALVSIGVAAALLLTIVGVIMSYRKGRKAAIVCAGVAAGAMGSLIATVVTNVSVDDPTLAPGLDHIEFGIYVTAVALAVAAVVHAIVIFRPAFASTGQARSVTRAPPDPPRLPVPEARGKG